MWKYLLQKCGVLIHGAIQRNKITKKNCMGLLNGYSMEIPRGTLLGLIPISSCPSPALLAQTPWKVFCSDIDGYEIMADHLKFRCEANCVHTLLNVALFLKHPSPEGDYLRFIAQEMDNPLKIRAHLNYLSEKERAVVLRLEEMKDLMIEDLYKRVSCVSVPIAIDKECLRMANFLCESRCVDVPSEQNMFGGPVYVPLLDLVNHSENANVAVTVYPTPQLKREQRNNVYPEITRAEIDDHIPFYVAAHATEDIGPSEELTYPYVDKSDDAFHDRIHWASRFHFLP